MVGLVSLIRIVGGGLHQFGFTVFFLPISQDLGLSRAATSLAFSLSRAQGAIEAPLVGHLIDRYGPRPIIVTAVFLAGVGYILLSWVNSYASFLTVYLGVICLAFVAGFVHSPLVVANNWFIRQRARAMTVISAAVPVGGALISPLLAVGVASIGCGIWFLLAAKVEAVPPAKRKATQVELPPALLARVFLIMTLAATSASLLFNFSTNGNYELLHERFIEVSRDPAFLGLMLALVYTVASIAPA